MPRFLHSLPQEGPSHTFERTDIGFALIRRATGDREAFDKLARRAIELAGEDFVALPSTDGHGYDRVIIIPFE